MKRLHSPQDAARWLRTQVRGVLHTDSRRVGAGDGFIAWPGGVTDGRQFVASALKQGATACVVEQSGADAFAWTDSDAIATYDGLKAASGLIAAAYYEQPSQALDVVAITGTNGKTSTAWWLAHALQALGQRCALVGTLGVGEPAALQTTGMTTPDPVLLQAHLRQWLDDGVQACAMEASSIGIAEHRLDGTHIRVAVFTNFTQDHLDYHGNMQAYWQAKAALFDWPGLQAAVINIDDAQGAQLAQQLQGAGLALWTCSRQETSARLQAQRLPSREGLCLEVREGTQSCRIDTALMGDYNIDNLLGVIGALRAQGVSLADAARACGQLEPVPGRMQRVSAAAGRRAPLAVVDYAHTPDALRQALAALRPLAQERGGRLWCVFGCGGDRDPIKRPLMAAVAEQGADRVVLTSDNPRSESPAAILAQVRAGLRAPHAALQIEDRAEAIAQALVQAAAADVLLVAGKGHERSQEIAGVLHPFSDVAQITQALEGQTWA